MKMQPVATFCLCAGLVFGAGSGAAWAARLPDFTNPSFPIEHQTLARFAEEPKSPYAMTYMEDVARGLGVVSGKMDVFDTGRSRDPLMPSLKGGIDRGGLMMRLQWHPGE
jgi:hypothetical protein